MQYTGSFRTVSRTGVQLAIVAAVAVAGIAVGRWGIPAQDSLTVETSSRPDVADTSDRFETMAERKLAQIDARDAGRVVTVESTVAGVLSDAEHVVPLPDSAVERKLAQTSEQSAAISDVANVAPIPESAVERNLAQTSAESGAISDAANVAPIPESAVDRKLAQTGSRGFTSTTTSTGLSDPHAHHNHALHSPTSFAPIPSASVTREARYEAMFETKFAQMDAQDAR